MAVPDHSAVVSVLARPERILHATAPLPPTVDALDLVKSVSICALIVIAATYFFGLTAASRAVILLFAAFSVVALFAKDQQHES